MPNGIVLEQATAAPEPNATEADLSRARTALAYEPRTPLRTGLREQVLDHSAQFRNCRVGSADTEKAEYAEANEEDIRSSA
jgi:hypothetical protein